MREIRLSGSEGGETAIKAVFPTPIQSLVAAILAAGHFHQAICQPPGCSSALTLTPSPFPPAKGARRQKRELILAQAHNATSGYAS